MPFFMADESSPFSAGMFIPKSERTGGKEMAEKYFRKGVLYEVTDFYRKLTGSDEIIHYLVLNDSEAFQEYRELFAADECFWVCKVIYGMDENYRHDSRKCLVEMNVIEKKKLKGLESRFGLRPEDYREYQDAIQNGSECGKGAFRAIVRGMIDADEGDVLSAFTVPIGTPEKVLGSLGRPYQFCDERLHPGEGKERTCLQKEAEAEKIRDFTGTVYEVSEYLTGKGRLFPCERYFISADSGSIFVYRATRIVRDSGLSKEEIRKRVQGAGMIGSGYWILETESIARSELGIESRQMRFDANEMERLVEAVITHDEASGFSGFDVFESAAFSGLETDEMLDEIGVSGKIVSLDGILAERSEAEMKQYRRILHAIERWYIREEWDYEEGTDGRIAPQKKMYLGGTTDEEGTFVATFIDLEEMTYNVALEGDGGPGKIIHTEPCNPDDIRGMDFDAVVTFAFDREDAYLEKQGRPSLRP